MQALCNLTMHDLERPVSVRIFHQGLHIESLVAVSESQYELMAVEGAVRYHTQDFIVNCFQGIERRFWHI